MWDLTCKSNWNHKLNVSWKRTFRQDSFFSLNSNFPTVFLVSFNLIMGANESLVLTRSFIKGLFFSTNLKFTLGKATTFSSFRNLITSVHELLSAIVDKEWRTKKPRFRVNFVTKLSYLAARPSLPPRPLQVFVPFFYFAQPTDPPSREGGRWETKH